MNVFPKNCSVEQLEAQGHTFNTFRKKVLTKMTRVSGPFTVETSEGTLSCQDGFLAFDARGYPYPIAASEQELIYEPATE